MTLASTAILLFPIAKFFKTADVMKELSLFANCVLPVANSGAISLLLSARV